MKKEDFHVVSVTTRSNNAGMVIKYRHRKNTGGIITESEQTAKEPRVPHPDFTKAMQALTVFAAKPLHLGAISSIHDDLEAMTEDQKKALKKLAPYLDNKQKEIFDQIDVRGMHLSGKEDSQAVIISVFTSCKSMGSAMNTPRLRLAGDMFGNEIALSAAVDDVIEEAYQYLFKNKQAQLDAFREQE